MIVIGVDPKKRSHTAAAVDAGTGELRGAKTVPARDHGHGELVLWARSFGEKHVFAVEDCRHVSGGLESFLLACGERVVRVAPKLMAGARQAERERGKSDAIDAQAVARAAFREGVERLPCARLDERALELKLLLDHRDDLVGERTRMQNRLRWHLHDLIPELEIPAEGARSAALAGAHRPPPGAARSDRQGARGARACAPRPRAERLSAVS